MAKVGSGTFTLTGARHLHRRRPCVSAGKFVVGQGGSGSLGATALTVGGTGTLGGNGTVAGPVGITSGGTLAPGNSVGTLGTGNLSLASGSTYSVELDPANASATAPPTR